jgi:RimJ/RimL family protein N-acetyltransferase
MTLPAERKRKKITVRPADYEADLPAIVALINAVEPHDPTTVEKELKNYRADPPECRTQYLVAVDEQGRLVGMAHLTHPFWSPDRHYYVWIGVDPAFQGQRSGSALWRAALAHLQAAGATRLECEAGEKDQTSLAVALRCGFTPFRQLSTSSLDLLAFDETPYLALIAELEEQGIRFCALADFPDRPENQAKFYALNLAIVQDIPGEDWDFSRYPDFFQKRILGSPRFNPAGQLLALDGEHWVGLAAVSLDADSKRATNATTGVIRSHRGRGIALALKVLAARYARQHGAESIHTQNDSLNTPILAINHKLGYRSQPGKTFLVRWLPAPEEGG